MNAPQQEKIARFRALHAAPGAFVIPNPWDAGSARLLAQLGFPALATSSSASAGTLGRCDYGVSREEALRMATAIVTATDLPVSADLENGFGDAPDAVVETVRGAAAIGLAGCSIEDAAGDEPPYDLGLATERVSAAVETARRVAAAEGPGALPIVITARAENFLRGRPDLDDTIARLQAFERAGADVLFAPALPNLDAVRAVCAAVSKPVNVIGYIENGSVSVAELAAAGVKRISLATVLYRVALAAVRDAARQVHDQGTFTFAATAMKPAELHTFLEER